MKQLFRGGIHPNDGKALSRGGAPVPAPAPSRVIIPMSQHIGAPCSPLVKVGDTVKLGQKRRWSSCRYPAEESPSALS